MDLIVLPVSVKLLCHIVMFYKPCCSIYIHPLLQNLIVQSALPWERHSFHRFLKIHSADVLSLLLLLSLLLGVFGVQSVCGLGIACFAARILACRTV